MAMATATAKVPANVIEAMEGLGAREGDLLPSRDGRGAWRVDGSVVHLSTQSGKRAFDLKEGKEVDPRTGRPVGAPLKGGGGEALGTKAEEFDRRAREIIGQIISGKEFKTNLVEVMTGPALDAIEDAEPKAVDAIAKAAKAAKDVR